MQKKSYHVVGPLSGLGWGLWTRVSSLDEITIPYSSFGMQQNYHSKGTYSSAAITTLCICAALDVDVDMDVHLAKAAGKGPW